MQRAERPFGVESRVSPSRSRRTGIGTFRPIIGRIVKGEKCIETHSPPQPALQRALQPGDNRKHCGHNVRAVVDATRTHSPQQQLVAIFHVRSV
jgi:hypothetical protein